EKPAKITPGDVNHDKDLFISVSLYSAGKVARLRQIVPVGFNWAVVQNSTVGSSPTDIVSGDVDNDGDFDVVVANEGTNTVSILLMDIGGLFEDELVIEVGNEPSSVDLLDYDGDSDLDLAIIATNDVGQRVVMLYRNDTSLNPNQNITFALEQVLDEGLSPILLSSGELDGDAADDLVTIITGPSFRGVPQLAIRSIPNTACIGDIDQNNVIDIVDLLALISTWGTAAGDITGDGMTDVEDLLLLISGWGLCP
ncbi:MAG: FG-GAP-like repeat-containing protein, partial [Phycisphaerales bacterium]